MNLLLKKITLLLFFLCFAGNFSIAQPTYKVNAENKYRAVHWTIYDGLSQAETYHILKDVNGFVWIGTKNGLDRFDGSLFKNYYHDPHDKKTIGGNLINGMIEDSLHNIWIGYDWGLSRYDIKADTFSNYPNLRDVGYRYVTPFWASKNNLYAIESGSRIIAYDIHSFKRKTLVNLNLADTVDDGPGRNYALVHPASNSAWVLFYSSGEAGLLNVPLSGGPTKRYTWPCYLKIPHHYHSSTAMVYDAEREAIWINSPDGLMEFTLKDKQFHHIDAFNDILKFKDYSRLGGIALDLQGRIWLASTPKGILIYDPSNQSLSYPFPADPVIQRDVSDANAIIYSDRDGIIWLGTSKRRGFYQLIPYSPVVKLYTPNAKLPLGLSDNCVVSVSKAIGGNLWVGTGNGLYEFNGQTGELKALNKRGFPGLKAHKLIAIEYIDPHLNIAWMATDAGYFQMDIKTKVCRPVVFKDSLGKTINVGAFTVFLPLKNSWIIIGPCNNIDGPCYDKQFIFTGKGDNVTARQAVSLPNSSISPIYATTDHDHLLFVKQEEKAGNLTFSYLGSKLLRIHHKMDSLQWTSIFFNQKDRTYWVAAAKKIMHFSKDFKIISAYGPENGLPDIEIVSLIADNEDNIWFHTDRTIHQLNVKTGEISTLTEKDGFEKQDFFLQKNNFKDDNGDIYFPGGFFGSGFDKITPGKYTTPQSSIYLRSLEINQKPFPLSTGVNNLKELTLQHSENKITIETGIIDYYSKGASHMRYKLEGKEKNENWQYGPANYTIRFESLLPGTYKLRIQASNAAFQFNGPEKVLIIKISPALWDTWWFRLVVIIFAAYAIVSIFKGRIKKIRNEAFIQNQLKELEMKALKAQMNPHFIYNALNSIQALVANDKKDEGIHYIGSFSRLLRQVLDHSENNVISLDKELETIGLYIQLESLRLDMQLQYEEIIPENLVPEFEKLPPLILQPFVENALWHGLSRKESDKHVKIAVELNHDWLICEITDNGIGRKKAGEWNSNSTSIHQSKGIDITQKRLIDYNENDSIIPIEFFDLYDNGGKSTGTRVIVRIKRKSNLHSF